MIQNRCTNEANPLTFCPICTTWHSNSNHFNVHADTHDEAKLRAYVKGVFSSGLRGPLYRQDVLERIQLWTAAGTLRENIDKVFAVVGVGLTDSKTASMPLYDLQHCFRKDTVSGNFYFGKVYNVKPLLSFSVPVAETRTFTSASRPQPS